MTLAQLESHLGKALFESDRKAKLSAVGAFKLTHARKQLRHFNHTISTIETFANAGTGRVRIASVPTIASTILPLAFKTFSATYPNVQIELRDMDSASVIRAMENERVDIGIATLPAGKTPFTRTPLLTDNLGIVCRNDHRLAQKTSRLVWPDVQGEILIANDLWKAISDPEFQAHYQNASIAVQNTLSLLAMVKAGVGISVLPLMAKALHMPEITFRPIGDKRVKRQIDVLQHPKERMPPAGVNLIRHIIAASPQSGI